jgi:hypothetical protein
MHVRRWLAGLAAAAALAAWVGGGCGRPDGLSDARTPGEYFRDRQGATTTPNGRILVDTVAERDGRIEYRTEDGRGWRVTYAKRAEGTYQYGTPEEVVNADPEEQRLPGFRLPIETCSAPMRTPAYGGVTPVIPGPAAGGGGGHGDGPGGRAPAAGADRRDP